MQVFIFICASFSSQSPVLKGHRCQHESENKNCFNLFSYYLKIMPSFEHGASLAAPAPKQRKGSAGGFHHTGKLCANERLGSNLTSLVLPQLCCSNFLNTNKSNALVLSICSVIKLYCFLAPLAGFHTHTQLDTPLFWHSLEEAAIFITTELFTFEIEEMEEK